MQHVTNLEDMEHLVCLACLQLVDVRNGNAVMCLTCCQLMCADCSASMVEYACAKCRQEVALLSELVPGVRRSLG